MKRIVSILSILLILNSALRITIDRHFCGGRVVNVKLANNDKRASCGMEQDDLSYDNVISFKSNCCQNELSIFYVNDYNFASVVIINKPLLGVTQTLAIAPEVIYLNSLRTPVTISDTSPPGFSFLFLDPQSVFCTFRI